MTVDPDRCRRYLARTTPRPWRGWRTIGTTTDGVAIIGQPGQPAPCPECGSTATHMHAQLHTSSPWTGWSQVATPPWPGVRFR